LRLQICAHYAAAGKDYAYAAITRWRARHAHVSAAVYDSPPIIAIFFRRHYYYFPPLIIFAAIAAPRPPPPRLIFV